MQDYFIKTFRGHQFEFSRVLASSFDTWYHISVNLNNVDIKYRMHANKEGNWKITFTRLPDILYSLESEFNEVIKLNERPLDPDHYQRS